MVYELDLESWFKKKRKSKHSRQMVQHIQRHKAVKVLACLEKHPAVWHDWVLRYLEERQNKTKEVEWIGTDSIRS